MKKLYESKEWLVEKLKEHGSVLDLCKKEGFPKTTVRRYIDKFELNALIKKRTDYSIKNINYEKYPFKNKDWLINQIEAYGSPNEICRKTGCAETSVRRYIEKFELEHLLRDVPVKKVINYKKHPFKSKSWLKREVLIHKDVRSIAEATGQSKTSIRRYVGNFGLKEILIKPNDYRIREIDENYFEAIDTERKAYWLGMLMADGNVSDKGNKYVIRLCLKNEDIYLPAIFLKDIKSTSQIKIDKHGRGNARVFSKKMFNDLAKFNMLPRKTGEEKMPDNIPKSLMNHYIRGFYDGDGCISIRKRNNKVCKMSICCSNPDFLISLMKEVKEAIEIGFSLSKNKIYEMNIYSHENYIKFSNWLYKDATIAMIRKYERAKKYLNISCPSLEQFKEESGLIAGTD